VGLFQLVRFLMVKLIHQDLNLIFEMCVIFKANYSFSGGDVPIDSEILLVTNFVNLKIKLTQSFRYAHRYRMYVFIGMSTHTYISMCVYII
jgi:hypothetical protein